METNQAIPQFKFNFYHFINANGKRTTELTRHHTDADGMRSLVDSNPTFIELATKKAVEWANSHSISIIRNDPFPSQKYPGKVWLEFRFGGLSL